VSRHPNAERWDNMTDTIIHDHGGDGIDRRGFLKCMAWAGTGALWAMQGGVLRSIQLDNCPAAAAALQGELFFAQISDSHIGFAKDANPDVTATLQEAVDRLNRLPRRPAFVLHTGDISQLSKPTEFDTADQVIKGIHTERVFYVPGEHDVLEDNGRQYLERYGRKTRGDGWYSFDHSGVHFVGLVNVLNLKPGGLGSLGEEQLAWLRKDLAGRSASTPIVVFAHVPLWTVYPDWGWGTDDSEQALALLKRFGSVTVLNGHIHQVMQKVEGNVAFHTAVHGVPAARAGHSAVPGATQGGADAASEPARPGHGDLSPGAALAGDRGQPAPGRPGRHGGVCTRRHAARLLGRHTSGRGGCAGDPHRQLQLQSSRAARAEGRQGHLDQCGRRAAPDRQRGQALPSVLGARHERLVHADPGPAGGLSVLLHDPSSDDGANRRRIVRGGRWRYLSSAHAIPLLHL
jgi:3',5'-cyclic-AMP phosphodiesterase